jgi:hypothetical protein
MNRPDATNSIALVRNDGFIILAPREPAAVSRISLLSVVEFPVARDRLRSDAMQSEATYVPRASDQGLASRSAGNGWPIAKCADTPG